ncbi:MAG: hypothetical protein ACK58T_39185 [Phycisphaerae bacterium]
MRLFQRAARQFRRGARGDEPQVVVKFLYYRSSTTCWRSSGSIGGARR